MQTPFRKHLGLILDEKLNSGKHLRYIANKVNTSIGPLRKLQKSLPRRSIVTIIKNPLSDLILIKEILSLIRRVSNSMKV